MRKEHFWHAIIVFVAAFLSACSTTRYVPEGQSLLNSVHIDAEGKDKEVNATLLRSYVRQLPNARWFTLFKLPLATYSLSGRDTTRWLNRTLRNVGEPPVLFDSLLAVRTCADLRQKLQNDGFLRADVSLQVKRRGKKADVTYRLHPGPYYFIRNIRYEIADPQIAALLEARADSANRLLYEGMKFDVERLDAERKRLTSVLTDNGYFRFHKEFITYVADTVQGSRLIDIVLHLSQNKRSELPDTLHQRYYIRHIGYSDGAAEDERLHLRRHVLEECTHLKENQPYSATALQQTYNHFGRMQAVKYTNISLHQVPDTTLLDCDIQLQTNKPSIISFQPEGTNTSGDLGAAASLTYQNRNLFRGSELLSIELRGAYESIRGLEGYSNQDFMEYSVESQLAFPRFITPFFRKEMHRQVNAQSVVSLTYDVQKRPEFHRKVLSTAWRYKWSFPHRHDRYQLDVLDLNYVFMPWISQTFQREYLDNDNSRNAILRYNYEDLFIARTGFVYTYSHNNLALKTNVEAAGNLLSLGSRMFKAEKDADGQYRLFNIAFAQYVKADVDLTHSFLIDEANKLVVHVGLGFAYPYGNSTVLPFEKRYFSGGANSVRGWSVRSLGPGKYKERDGRINFINQTGDMKLDLNAEYRTHLFWKLDWALFVDAGNIWTIRDYPDQPGGQFRIDEFWKQLAVGYGMGFRFNFDYFIIRFDLGMKAVNPAYEYEEEDHLPLLHPRLSRDFAFHFAVGLPF